MTRTRIALLCLCAASTPVSGQTEEATARKKLTPEAEIKALEAEYDASKVGHTKKHAQYLPHFEAFAKKHRGTNTGLTAELWILSGCWWSRQAGTMNDEAGVVAKRILEYYFHSDELGGLMDRAYVFSTDQKEQIFGHILKVTRFPQVKAAVHLALGKLHYKSKDEALQNAGISHLKLLQKEFPGIAYRSTTFGQMANALLAPHQPDVLAIGKPAPEIEGVGLDGKPLKLSDFRGKIVVLDFWGDW